MSAVRDLVGVELGPTAWQEITQKRIDGFAEATGDAQWIHTDPVRAAAGPFGTTIAHGYLTLSLCASLLFEVLELDGVGLTVNYGVNRVRFPAPVPVGSSVRGRFTVVSVDDVAGGEQVVIAATVEREGADKPVCVAELVLRFLQSA
jgi:acyl dehydratase